MPMVAKCDMCERIVRKNVATDPIISTRNGLTVSVKVIKAKGQTPIICEGCARAAAYYGENGKAEEAVA